MVLVGGLQRRGGGAVKLVFPAPPPPPPRCTMSTGTGRCTTGTWAAQGAWVRWKTRCAESDRPRWGQFAPGPAGMKSENGPEPGAPGTRGLHDGRSGTLHNYVKSTYNMIIPIYF